MKYHSFVQTPADHPSPPVLPCHHGKEPLGKYRITPWSLKLFSQMPPLLNSPLHRELREVL